MVLSRSAQGRQAEAVLVVAGVEVMEVVVVATTAEDEEEAEVEEEGAKVVEEAVEEELTAVMCLPLIQVWAFDAACLALALACSFSLSCFLSFSFWSFCSFSLAALSSSSFAFFTCRVCLANFLLTSS